MDQIKIGKFIAECRKEKGLTQVQLAEQLGTTDKSVSKWENGVCLPDSSQYEPLCNILNILKYFFEHQSKLTLHLLQFHFLIFFQRDKFHYLH